MLFFSFFIHKTFTNKTLLIWMQSISESKMNCHHEEDMQRPQIVYGFLSVVRGRKHNYICKGKAFVHNWRMER